jgi:hypothetical protein
MPWSGIKPACYDVLRSSQGVQQMPAQARWLMPRADLRASSGWPTPPQTIIPSVAIPGDQRRFAAVQESGATG